MPAEHLVQQFILVVCIGLGLILYSEVLSRYIGQHGSAVYVGMVVVVRIPQYKGKLALPFYRT